MTVGYKIIKKMPNLVSNEIFRLLSKKTAVLWDFDGVILDSMSVRDAAFQHTLKDYPQEHVTSLIQWHQKNGGLSRYVKFRYFQTKILHISLDEDLVQSWAQIFSEYCTTHLGDRSRLIKTTTCMIESLSGKVPMHIVSGSDGVELTKLCNTLKLTCHFVSIHGSPTPKIKLVADVLKNNFYQPEKTILIGDSLNDYEAAKENSVPFIGFNNESLKITEAGYWEIK